MDREDLYGIMGVIRGVLFSASTGGHKKGGRSATQALSEWRLTSSSVGPL